MEGVGRNGKVHKAVLVNGRLIPACGIKNPGQTELNTLMVEMVRASHGASQDCKKCYGRQ